MRSVHRKRTIEDLLLISPQLVLFLTLTIIPLFAGIPLLFTDKVSFLDTTANFIGFENFAKIFQVGSAAANDYWPALQKTVRFTLLNYTLVYVFGLTLALVMYEVGFSGSFFTIIYLPWMISGFALGFIALVLFSESTGTINLLLLKLGWIERAFNMKLEEGTTIILPILVGWKSAGYYMAIFLGGLLSIPRETIEAATIDGATYFQKLFRIYFPQMIPAFIIATIMSVTGSFTVFAELVAMGGLYQNKAAEFLSIVFFKYGFSNRLALGMTMSVETFFPLLIIFIFMQRAQRRFSYD